MEKTIVLAPDHRGLSPPGGDRDVTHYHGAGVYYDPVKQESFMFYTRSKEHPHPYGEVCATRSTDNWRTLTHFDATGLETRAPALARPVLRSVDATSIAPNGQQDPRATALTIGPRSVIVLVVNSCDESAIRESHQLAYRDRSRPLRGATPELYVLSNPRDPASYVALGPIGPDLYFKNVMLHPELLDVRGQPHLLWYGRQIPGIQGFLIPLSELPALINDACYRRRYWQRQLGPRNIRSKTILSPIFSWESKGSPHCPDGQIAGGAPPLKVAYPDSDGKRREAWLFIYNGVPEFVDTFAGVSTFLQGFYAIGRVVGAALLDYANPFTVIARAPVPIITPTDPIERDRGRTRNTTFATGAYVDSEMMLRIMYTAGDHAIAMASCPLVDMMSYLVRYDAQGRERPLGAFAG